METVKKGKMFTTVSIGAATVWFSTHCGAGFASGTQELQYFANHGWYGTLLPFLTIFIIAITYYVGAETARQTDNWNYHDWAMEAYKPINVLGAVMIEITVVITTIAASAACIAAGATLGEQQLGWPPFVGSLAMFLIVLFLSIFGEKVVRNNAMIMTVAIIIIVIIVLVAGIVKFMPEIKHLFATKYTNPDATKWSVVGAANARTPASFGNAFLWALTYAGFQMGIIAAFSSSFKGAKSKRESKGAVILGYILNALMLAGVVLLIFGGMPEVYTNEEARVLPTLYMVGQLDMPILSVTYPILLFLALVTTAVGLTFALVERLNPYVLKNVKRESVRKGIIATVVLLAIWAVSSLGLMWVVQVAYKYLGIYNWVAIIIPLCTLGYRNIGIRDRAAKESAAG